MESNGFETVYVFAFSLNLNVVHFGVIWSQRVNAHEFTVSRIFEFEERSGNVSGTQIPPQSATTNSSEIE